MKQETALSERMREDQGWRTGRPVEDPGKTKRWGFITAKPSEFLIHCRKGKVLPSSGQGATCFKWPWDSVAVVPTSFQSLRFHADQVSRETVGVGITGIAVYRIADPLLAYRVLNFSYPERAQEKLELTLTEMLMGATRRLVANLTVSECLRKRKAALADELLAEIAPVIGGTGRPDDQTSAGWGVVLDTIEIQEVRILSESVFSAMQEPFRAQLDREARQARAEAEKQSALSEADSKREIETAQIDAAAQVRRQQSEVQRLEAESQQQFAIRKLELALGEEEARVRDALQRGELERQEKEAKIAGHELALQAKKLEDEMVRVALEAEMERARVRADVEAAIGRVRADVALLQARADRESAAARAQILTAQHLPAVAQAVGAGFGDVKVTQIGGGDSAFSSVAQVVSGVLELARSSNEPQND